MKAADDRQVIYPWKPLPSMAVVPAISPRLTVRHFAKLYALRVERPWDNERSKDLMNPTRDSGYFYPFDWVDPGSMPGSTQPTYR